MRVRHYIKKFIQLESFGGIILLISTLIAIVFKNTALQTSYEQLLQFHFSIGISPYTLNESVLFWINEGLMALFFLLVSLEIKSALYEGELRSLKKAIMPAATALGGMLFPALIYILLNYQDHYMLRGWGIPTATDIAFSLGILSLLGKRIPTSLKIFLTALAILDDLGGILIIGIFYNQQIHMYYIMVACALLLLLWILNRCGIKHLAIYSALGVILWFCILKTGIHPSLSGVLLAFAIPLHDPKNSMPSPLHNLEQSLHSWVVYLVLPLFAFSNAGLSFQGLGLHALNHSVVWGIVLGLFFGKQLGIMLAAALMLKMRWGHLPQGTRLVDLYGIAVLCGIGFTMSLFMGELAFPENTDYFALIRLGIFAGSLLSGAIGYCILRYSGMRRLTPKHPM